MSQQINLFNPIFLKQKKYFSALTMVQALGMILLGIGAIALYAKLQLAHLRPEASAVTAQLEAAQAQLAAVKTGPGGRAPDSALEAQVRHAEAEVAALQRIAALLRQGEGANVDGYSEYMRAFARQILDGVWLTGFSIGAGGRDIVLSGRALRPELVPAYLARLSSEPTMHGRAFGVLEMNLPEAEPEGQGAVPSFVEFRLQSTGAARAAAGEASKR